MRVRTIGIQSRMFATAAPNSLRSAQASANCRAKIAVAIKAGWKCACGRSGKNGGKTATYAKYPISIHSDLRNERIRFFGVKQFPEPFGNFEAERTAQMRPGSLPTRPSL